MSSCTLDGDLESELDQAFEAELVSGAWNIPGSAPTPKRVRRLGPLHRTSPLPRLASSNTFEAFQPASLTSLSSGAHSDTFEGELERAFEAEFVSGAWSASRSMHISKSVGNLSHPQRIFPAKRPSSPLDVSTSHGCMLLATFHISGRTQVTLLEEGIQLLQREKEMRSLGDPMRSLLAHIMADGLEGHFQKTNDVSLLEDIVTLRREVFAHPPPWLDRGHLCWQMTASLNSYYQYMKGKFDFEEATHLVSELLKLRPVGHPDWSDSCRRAAFLLKHCFENSQDVAYLDHAISLHRQLLALSLPDNPDYALTCANLALSLQTHYDRCGILSVLDEAVALGRKALALSSSDSSNRRLFVDLHADSLWRRFRQSGDLTLLDEVIQLHRESLDLSIVGPQTQASACIRLTMALKARFVLTQDEAFLDEALDLEHAALEHIPEGHPEERAILYSALASSIMERFTYRGGQDMQLPELAIKMVKEGLSSLPDGHPQRAELRLLLASLNPYHTPVGIEDSVMEEALGLHPDALVRRPVGHPERCHILLSLAGLHLGKGGYGEHMTRALDYIHQALNSGSPNLHELLSSVTTFLQGIDNDALSADQRRKMLSIYATTIDLALLVAGFILDHAMQLQYLEWCSMLGPGAYLLARAEGDINTGLELLERARGIVWTQALHLRDPQLRDIPPTLATELELLLRELGTRKVTHSTDVVPGSFLTRQDMRYAQHDRVQAIIHEVRDMPGFSGFMRGPGLDALMRTAAADPVVVLVAAKDTCYALVIRDPKTPLASLPLHGITSADVEIMVKDWTSPRARGGEAVERTGDRLGLKESESTRSKLVQLLAKLWKHVVKPIFVHLGLSKKGGRERPRIHWCPTGAFTFVPVHAAGIYNPARAECVADYVVSSYTPTLAALVRAQERAQSNLTVKESKAVLIAAERAYDATLHDLPCVSAEIDAVETVAARAGLNVDTLRTSTSTTTTNVATSLGTANIAHIACHGIQNRKMPLESGFCLTDDRLTVARLMELDLQNAFFAFLSACETAKGDEKQPDQTIHLGATMLFVGFKSVVATMWAMHDEDGPRVAKTFYEELFQKEAIDAASVPYALDHAVMELRRSGAPLERWATFIHMGA